MRKISILLFALFAFTATAQTAMDKYIDDLMARMTLQEKIGQLNLEVAGDITTGLPMTNGVLDKIPKGLMGGIFNLKGADKIREMQRLAIEESRLSIPLIVGMDVIHGYETIFPIPFAMACSWDPEGIEQTARVAAKEATADGINLTFSPMVDINIDPRWGRVSEGSCEDPYLLSQVGAAIVRGYQGNFSNQNMLSCVKHFALYGASEAGKDYNTVDMSHVRMYNRFFPPYRAAVDAGAACIMPSFNVVDGIPATSNTWLLQDVLRHQWGFKGLVVSDYGAVGEMISHGMGDGAACAMQAVNAGNDMDMCTTLYIQNLENAVKEGKVSEATINAACRRVLEAKYKLGLFDDPYKFCDASRHDRDVFTAENRRIARDFAAETFVLLKNKNNVLPLKKEGKIALIGPLSKTRNNMVGAWVVAFTPERYATLEESMSAALKGTSAQLMCTQGCNIMSDSVMQVAAEFGKTITRVNAEQGMREALAIARDADVIVCAMGECADMSGECACRTNLDMPDEQRALLQELVRLGKPVVLLNFSGRVTTLGWEYENVDAILNVWFPGSEAGDAICDVLFGDKAPSGKLSATVPQSVGQIPLYYNHLNTGRPVPDGTKEFRKYQSNYLDIRNDPLFPFGFGLSYTTFAYGAPTVTANTLTSTGGSVTVNVAVTNTGNYDADEVAQLYVRDPVATISRPVKELKGFKRIHLQKGETKTVSFTVSAADISYYDGQGNTRLEPGEIILMTGPNSQDLQTVSINIR